MIAIIVAMKIEYDALVQKIDQPIKQVISGHEFVVGTIANQEVVVNQCGVGKVASAISTTCLIENFHPTAVINTGVAGGLKEDENVLDIVISNRLTYHDWDTTAIGDQASSFDCAQYLFQSDEKLIAQARQVMEQIKDQRVLVGDIVSGDQFIVKDNVEKILQQFPTAIASEMEATSIAHCCHDFSIPFVCIRSLSDITVKEGSQMDFMEFVGKACQVSVQFIELFLRQQAA